jgi:hypothetical protein
MVEELFKQLFFQSSGVGIGRLEALAEDSHDSQTKHMAVGLRTDEPQKWILEDSAQLCQNEKQTYQLKPSI